MAPTATPGPSPAARVDPNVRHRDLDATGLPLPAPDRPDALGGLSVVVATRDDAPTAAGAIASAARAAARTSLDYEIVAVDDGSSDETTDVIARLCRPEGRVRLLVHAQPLGPGAALRAGIAASSMPWILLIDASDELDLAGLDDFLPLASEHDLLLGWRVMRRGRPAARAGAAIWNRLVSRAVGVSVRDVDCPAKLARRDFLERAQLTSSGRLIEAELVAAAERLDASVAEVPVSQRAEPVGGGSVGTSLRLGARAVLGLGQLLRLRKRHERRLARGALAVGVAAVAVVSGVGWLYQLRSAGLLAGGPRLGGALPLQQLAGDDAQPVLRMAGAWLPAGVVSGLSLGYLGRFRRPPLVTALVGATLLVVAGAASDAIASGLRVTPRLLPQFARPGLWGALILLTIGAALVARLEPRPRT